MSGKGREWVVTRRARTRHLIELGGLVVKSRLVDLPGDDRAAVLYGAFLEFALTLHGENRENRENREQVQALWARRGSSKSE